MHVHFLNGSVKNKLMLVLPLRLNLGNLNPIDCQAVVGSIICASFFAIFAIYAHIVAGPYAIFLLTIASFVGYGHVLSADTWPARTTPQFQSPPSALKTLPRSCLLLATMLCACLQPAASGPVTVDLTKFSSGAGCRIHGGAPSQTGFSVAVVGDHNGDGFEDYIFGSSTLHRAIIVMKRNTTYVPMTTDSIVSGEFFRVILGPTGTSMGNVVGGVGDINGDSFDDVIVAAPNGNVAGRNVAGYAFVIFGMTGPFTDLTVTAIWAPSSLGFQVLGVASSTSLLQTTRGARGIGDVNGDGVDDFALCAHNYERPSGQTDEGVVWVIFGKVTPAFSTVDLKLTNLGSDGIYYNGEMAGAKLGHLVMPAGDFNGDGIADFLMGAPDADPTVNGVVRSNAGLAYLIYGSRTSLATTDLTNFVTGNKGVRFVGGASNGGLGRSLAGVGDINDDGKDDIAIGVAFITPAATPERNGAGMVHVIYGTSATFTADFDMIDFNAFNIGFSIYGRAAGINLATVARAGDIDGDGINDILVGGATSSSDIDIVYGQKEERTAHVDTKTADGTSFIYTDGAFNALTFDGGADFNGDGFPDLIIGAQAASVTPEGGGALIATAGAVWMLPGPYIWTSQAPTTAPTPGAPSPEPSRLPSAPPTARPTRDPTARSTRTPTSFPSRDPTLNPTAIPSVYSTIEPSANPSVDLTSSPTDLNPTIAPTLLPSVDPSANPTLDPSAGPSVAPTIHPSAAPSFSPSTTPSIDPSVDPSVTPSFAPSATPSGAPTRAPSASPSKSPSVVPTTTPSQAPSMIPTQSPNANPSVTPSNEPTLHPTVKPSIAATVTPSAIPTIRPTSSVDKDFALTVNVEQDVLFIDKDGYNAQQAASNLTIQHTVADAVDGATPERVTDIVVEEEEEEGGRTNLRIVATAAGSIKLAYTITVHDPTYTVEKLRAELVQAAEDGRMDNNLRFYATHFGATSLINGTFARPLVTYAGGDNNSSVELTGTYIALIVIGAVVVLLLIAVGLSIVLSRRAKANSVACGAKD